MTHRRAGAALTALSLAVGAIVGVQAFARVSASYDYGDAPDSAKAGYVGRPDVVAHFPSKAASGGPRHGGAGPRLGTTWNAEPASRQVNRDLDDGSQVTPRSCALSTLKLTIDVSRADTSTPIYVNAWFDWNQDGDWADGGTRTCGPEWGVQNVKIDAASLGEGRIGVVTLRFRAGKAPRQFWWRAQVHQGLDLVPHRAGGGQGVATSGGETEDWLYGREPKSDVGLVCGPEHAIMTHGRVHDIDFRLIGRSPTDDFGILRSRGRLDGEADGVVVRRPVIPDGWRIRLVSVRRHDRKPIAQSFRVMMVVDARINGRPRLNAFRASCGVTIVHGAPIFPPFQPPKQLTPAITVPTGRVVINPNNPTPKTARCGASISDGLAYFRVRTVCKGVHIKSTTVWFATGPVRMWADSPGEWSARLLKRCGRYSTSGALKCWWNPPNVGRTLEHRVFPPGGDGRSRIVLHVLAGGRGETGTAIVLRQQWYALGGGKLTCSQSVPLAKSCTSAD